MAGGGAAIAALGGDCAAVHHEDTKDTKDSQSGRLTSHAALERFRLDFLWVRTRVSQTGKESFVSFVSSW